MRKIIFPILALIVSGCSLSLSLIAQAPALQWEEAPPSSIPIDVTSLPISSALRAEVEGALERRDFKRAESILVEESERHPKSIDAGRLLEIAAGVFFLDGQYLDAAIAWKRAEAIAPLNPRSQFTLAMSYIKLGRRDWARNELERLGTAQPTNPLFVYWLARLDYDDQRYTAAMERLEKVIQLDSKMMRAYDLLGLCYDYLGQFDEAIKSYTRAVELNRLQAKPSPWPLVDMSVSLVALNRMTEAEKSLREALSYDGRLPQAHYQLGRILEMQQQDQAAAQSLKQAVALDSSYAEPHYLLGRVYKRLGENQLAEAEIEQFKRLTKGKPEDASSGPHPPTK
jgi:tetratricopeptide (TPR) repeat protein